MVVRAVQPESLSTDYDPIGHTVNLASRLEAIAEPGWTLVSESTHRLTKDYFRYADEGAVLLKGMDETVRVHRLLGPGPVGSRFGVARGRGLEPFIGRGEPLERLCARFGDACAGAGNMVGIFGEPGIGKTRLIHEFKRRIDRPCRVLDVSLSAYDRGMTYHCVASLLRQLLDIAGGDDQAAIERKLRQVWYRNESRQAGLSAPVLGLLGIGSGDAGGRPFEADTGVLRSRVEVAMEQVLESVTQTRPVVLMVDDVQWADYESLELLMKLSARLQGRRILVILGARIGIMEDIRARAICEPIVLRPFARLESKALLDCILGTGPGLAQIKSQIISRASGNPLFLEEVVQSLIEQGVLRGDRGALGLASTHGDLAIPATVQSILSARIDALEPRDKSLLQLMAIIGRDVPVGLLIRVAETEEAELRRQLDRLARNAFIVEKPAFPELEYGLRHPLISQVAVESLLKEQRTSLHLRVGSAFETFYASQLNDQSPALAFHFLAGADAPRALTYLYMAAKRAQQGGLHADAIDYVEKALEVLEGLEKSVENLELELRLLLLSGTAWMAQKGFSAPELEVVYDRALWLARHLDDPESLFKVVFGLRLYHFGSGRLGRARDLAQELVEMAQRAGDNAFLMEARLALGGTLFPMGQLREAKVALDEAVAIHACRPAAGHSLQFGMDPGVTGLALVARVLWYQGYPEQATERAREAVCLARSLDSPYEQAFALVFAAEVHANCGDDATAIELLSEAIALSGEMGFRQWLTRAHIMHGWCQARSLAPEAGRSEAFEWIERYRESGIKSWLALYCSYKSAMLAAIPAHAEALSVNAEGIEVARKNGEYLCLPELLSIRASIFSAMKGAAGQAEMAECLDEAMRIAETLGARALQLRVALERCRLFGSGEERSANRRTLLNIYRSFSEGNGTRDLERARLLLARPQEGEKKSRPGQSNQTC
ncbi:ATP-binding protein [Marinobacterium aestuariivivens]|uniref:ATP-binding protein n=1 Tax=Marinobacterium aestuariivivens TaxID=1698799 RepID=A0ABW1ZXT7_9GAMM